MFYEMLFGDPPFIAKDAQGILKRIKNQDLHFNTKSLLFLNYF
jgi:hypothetical protein